MYAACPRAHHSQRRQEHLQILRISHDHRKGHRSHVLSATRADCRRSSRTNSRPFTRRPPGLREPLQEITRSAREISNSPATPTPSFRTKGSEVRNLSSIDACRGPDFFAWFQFAMYPSVGCQAPIKTIAATVRPRSTIPRCRTLFPRRRFMTSFTLNGKPVSVDEDPATPLLWVIRDSLGLTGTKFGCGMALCGACTVHLDGRAIRSCVSPLSRVEGKQVTTVEGLSSDNSHPVQRAWIEIDVPQCGYCQSGQIMSAAVLLKENPKPTDADIDEAMSGNICRCGTYPRIRRAIHRAAELAAGKGT